jgi:hypothetical protein
MLHQLTPLLGRLDAHGARASLIVPAAPARRLFKVVAVAVANKMAHIAWALLAKGGSYRLPRLAAA